MKIILILLACLLSLPLFVGCGETEDTSESVVSAELIRKAEAKPFVMIYADTISDATETNILKRLEPIYQRKLSGTEVGEALLAVAGDTETQATLDWQVHREDFRTIHTYLLHNLRIVWYPVQD